MSKNYDLYPNFERKIDNWRRRILGYEKMKRDLQRQIQLLKNKNKKQKEVIDKVNELIKQHIRKDGFLELNEWQTRDLLDILNDVSEWK